MNASSICGISGVPMASANAYTPTKLPARANGTSRSAATADYTPTTMNSATPMAKLAGIDHGAAVDQAQCLPERGRHIGRVFPIGFGDVDIPTIM